MAGPKSDKDQYFGLTPSQAKMILLGALYTEDSKPDMTRLAQKANITVTSARTMYTKALKRFRELEGSDDTPLEDTTPAPAADGEEAPKELSKAKKPRGAGRKRKHDEDEPAPKTEEHEEQAEYELEPKREDEPAELHREEPVKAEIQSVGYDADEDA